MICGIDFSSIAIHAAIVPLDDDAHGQPPLTLRAATLPAWKASTTTPAFRSVKRCAAVPEAMRELLADVDGWSIAQVCVETPFGASRKADNVMRELYGAILASIPPHIERDTITTHEWRRIVAPKPGEAIPGDPYFLIPTQWKTWAINYAYSCAGIHMSEHHAEAYLIARAARTRLHTAVA